jgi:DNA-directed RNA polymerase II subunit RPB2
MELGPRGEEAKALAEHLLNVYFKTQEYPYTRHHIESYDQFLSQDLPAIIKAQNPILLLHGVLPALKAYEYKAEIFIGGLEGDRLYIGSPTISLQDSEEIRLLFPNEARLRNLSYAALVEADIVVRITYTSPNPSGRGVVTKEQLLDSAADPVLYSYLAKFPMFRIPIMLHSRYCLLYGKPQMFLKEAGECQYDNGGYFIVDGSEKVLITHQEQAFNTLYITPQERDPKVAVFSSITCLNPANRRLKRVAFILEKGSNTLQVSLPFVRDPVPVFLLFRALGVQSDEDILRLIFPDADAAETKILAPLLHESIIDANPFYDTFSAVQYIKALTKGFSEAHVLDILYNQTFIHVENRPKARATFLAECVRRILRVHAGIDPKTDRDDIRNQRCQTSGTLTRMLFQGVYSNWFKAVRLTLDKEYNYNKGIYEGDKYANLFLYGVMGQILKGGRLEGEHRDASKARDLTVGIMRAFRGKWSSGTGAGVGEEKSGVIQSLSRLSYLDFMSHCRRVVLDFDTGMKLPGPRRLHTSQYGYFCTSETPGGASIGIAKNLSMLTSVSVASDPAPFIKWLLTRGGVTGCDQVTAQLTMLSVPVFVNSGIVGYTLRPVALRDALKVLKWTGCLPASASVGFSIRDRRVFIYLDEGRPIRPLIHLGKRGSIPIEALQKAKSWRDLVLGVLPQTIKRSVYQGGFMDPLAGETAPSLEDYVDALAPNSGVIEYVDPYEMNETYVANFPENIQPETSHMEIHPSTIVGLLTSMIPFANHNQSPRNQLGDSQSKQAIAVYATNYMNRYDNQAHVLCYGQAPLVRTMYYDFMADGQMGYGHNIILAMGSFTGYNQDDGIVMNADSFARGMFRSTCYRSYEAFEEDDPMTHGKTRIGNPAQIPGWTSLKPGLDYGKLDARGIIRVGEYVDETTVVVGMYLQSQSGDMRDASKAAQVWTRGRVERISVTVNNQGLVMVKVRVVQERIPELGDKFCLTADHEVLTTDGWVAIDKVSTAMKVAQLNKDTEQLEYVNPIETFEFDHTGDMYEVKTQGINLCTTLNHRMWVQGRNSKTFECIEAEKMMGKRMRFSSYSPTSASDYTFSQGGVNLSGESFSVFLQLFGIWMAEGWVYTNERDHINRLEISADKHRVLTVLESVCEKLELNTSFNTKSRKFYINSKEYVDIFRPLSVGAINKFLPKWCFELSMEQSRILLESMCLGDGHETATSLSYSTSSIKLRDDIQIIVQHAGYTSGFYKHVEEGSTRVDSSGRVYKANADNWHVQIRRKRLYPTLNHGHSKTQGGQTEEIIQYSGKVFCISVPSQVFLVRRNGTIVWTGNSNRHGQKGTIGMFVRGYDMPRTKEGIPVDMIMNPHAIPSRMTVAQLIEALVGRAAPALGTVADGTLFMNDGSPVEAIGKILRDQLGMEPFGEELMYDGMGGKMVPTQMFLGNVYTMRLKHMPEDKWNARGEGRREQRTHAPTGGRGAQGGLRIGEMERDAILGHGVADFLRESLMKRADGYQTVVCNGCGTIPIYNEREGRFICPMCDGPVKYIGDSSTTLDILPPTKRSVASFSRVEMPYAVKLLDQEMNTYLNMGMRFLTTKDMKHFRPPPFAELTGDQEQALLDAALPERVLPETTILEYLPAPEEPEVRPEDLAALGAVEEPEPAPVAAPVPVPVPAPTSNNQNGIVLNLGNMNIGMPTTPEEEEDDISFVRGEEQEQQQPQPQPQQQQQPQPQPQQQPNQQGGGQGVNVQTTSQPVLVIPLNMNKPADPTQVIPAPAPGAPQTIAVDTSPNAMRGIGAAQPPRNNTSQKKRNTGAPASVVNVSKVGGSAPPPAANVRVTVNKTG